MALSSSEFGLDSFVDQTLEFNYGRSDWEGGALALMRSTFEPRGPVFAPTGFGAEERLERSRLRAFGREVGLDYSLGQVGDLAALMLATTRLGDAVEFALERELSPYTRALVVYHGSGSNRRSVLLLDPTIPADQTPAVLPSRLVADVIIEGVRQGRTVSLAEVFPIVSDPYFSLEIAAIARPRVIIARAPEMEFACVPKPLWTATCESQSSTVGALVRNAQGERGVTVCFHGTGHVGTDVRLVEGAASIDSKVTLASAVMDTCFVPIGDNWRPAALSARAGALDRRAPGNAELHNFTGGSSGGKTTRVVATDLGVPFITPGRQLCVHTTPDIDYGDSGAALINEDDRLVGFAFQRTAYGSQAPMAFASWIWAASALDELGLTLET